MVAKIQLGPKCMSSKDIRSYNTLDFEKNINIVAKYLNSHLLYLITKYAKHSFSVIFHRGMWGTKIWGNLCKRRSRILIFNTILATIFSQPFNYTVKPNLHIHLITFETQARAQDYTPISICFLLVETNPSNPRTISLWKCCATKISLNVTAEVV